MDQLQPNQHLPHTKITICKGNNLGNCVPCASVLTVARLCFLLRYGIDILHPSERLISAAKIDKHTLINPYFAKPPSSDVYLIPELIYILPISQDLLYPLSLADTFMPRFERSTLLHSVGYCYVSQACREDSEVQASSAILSELLDEATTLFPQSTYERLEFLGMLIAVPVCATCLTHGLTFYGTCQGIRFLVSSLRLMPWLEIHH
jgi:hypothetical protein